MMLSGARGEYDQVIVVFERELHWIQTNVTRILYVCEAGSVAVTYVYYSSYPYNSTVNHYRTNPRLCGWGSYLCTWRSGTGPGTRALGKGCVPGIKRDGIVRYYSSDFVQQIAFDAWNLLLSLPIEAAIAGVVLGATMGYLEKRAD
jgi:hypothetical protein